MRKSLRLSLFAASLIPLATFALHASTADNKALTALQHKLIDSFKAKDLDGIMSCYIPGQSVVVFDVVIPRQYVGAKAYRKDWADLLAAFPGPLQVEVFEPFVDSEGSMGYGHMVVHYILTDKDGHKMDLTLRLTDVYRKISGKWVVVHEHASFPVDFATGKPDLQSKP